jgi:hypothetical protein
MAVDTRRLTLKTPVNEFYKKGCQEKSSASTGAEILFSRFQPTVISLLWRRLAL